MLSSSSSSSSSAVPSVPADPSVLSLDADEPIVYTLVASDGVEFTLDSVDATFCGYIQTLIANDSSVTTWKVDRLTGAQLAPCVDYLRARKNTPQVPIGKDVIGGVHRLRKPCHWNQEVDAIDFAHTEKYQPASDHPTPLVVIKDFISYANYLEISPMFEVWAARMAYMIGRPNPRNPLDVIREFWGKHLTDDEAMKIWEELPRTEEEADYLAKNEIFTKVEG